MMPVDATRSAERGRAPALIVGVGNEWRGDDAAGILAARQLETACVPDADIAVNPQDGAALLELCRGYRHVFLIDAVKQDSPAGSVVVADLRSADLPAGGSAASSHLLGVADAVRLARVLSLCPDTFRLYGICGTAFDPGTPVSPSVRQGVSRVVGMILRDLPALTGGDAGSADPSQANSMTMQGLHPS